MISLPDLTALHMGGSEKGELADPNDHDDVAATRLSLDPPGTAFLSTRETATLP
jgi:hypothetical protein